MSPVLPAGAAAVLPFRQPGCHLPAMKNVPMSVVAASLSLASALCGCGAARAAGCPVIESAALKQATTPYHMVMDESGDQTARREMIQTDTTTYMLMSDKWVSVPYDAQERVKDMQDTSKDQTITCHNQGHDVVDGQPADHYVAQTKIDDGTTDADVWISPSTGLIVKERSVHTEDGKKTVAEIRFDYTNVTPPSDATPFKPK
jgi:hypothetical protein